MAHLLQIFFQRQLYKNQKRNNNVREVFIVIFLLGSLFTGSSYVNAANIIISPSKGTHHQGEIFSVDVYVNNNQDPINAVSGNITFSTETLELVAIKKTGSVITMWAEEPSFSNAIGSASFEGVILNPGFNGVQGKLLTLTFRVKKPGTGIVTLISGSVLANDGEATNLLGTLGKASFMLEATTTSSDDVDLIIHDSEELTIPVITSTTHPDNTKWYKSRDATFAWSLSEQVTAVKTLYDTYESSNPTRLYDPPISNRNFTVDTGGVQYMHVQFKTASGWGQVSHFKFRIDHQPPTNISATLVGGATTTNTKPSILITATDTVSGIGSIGITIDGQKEVIYPYSPTNTYVLPKEQPGNHSFTIHVYDMAGNYGAITGSYTIVPIDTPLITEYSKHVELGDSLIVKGTTYPFAILEVKLTDKNNKVITETTTANEGGFFSLMWQKSLETGAYEMQVRAIDNKGGVSDFTGVKLITLEHIPLIRFGIFIMNWLSLLLVCIVSIALVGATLWYSFVQFSRFRRKVIRTMRDAEMTLKANVLALRRDTEEFHTLLVKAEKKRELTKEEITILKKFKKRLDITEKEIEKKLEQIS
jgi:hypothetical protein